MVEEKPDTVLGVVALAGLGSSVAVTGPDHYSILVNME